MNRIVDKRGMSKRLRRAFEDLEEGVRAKRQLETGTSTASLQTASKPFDALGRVKAVFSNHGGTVTELEAPEADTLLAMRFLGTPVLEPDSGNLKLAGAYQPVDANDLLMMLSDGRDLFEVSRAHGPLGGAFIPAERYGCVPNTGVDMTTRIQRAFDECPAGATLVFKPGTYLISNTVWLSRSINIWAYGVIFDLLLSNPTTTFTSATYAIPPTYLVGGTSFLNRAGREAATLGVEKFNTAALVWGTLGSDRPQRCAIYGLHVSRSVTGGGPAARLHCGIVIRSAFECELVDTRTTNYFAGLVLTPNTGQGVVYNRITKHTSWDCRYAFTLYAADGGWVNQNTFEDIRVLNGDDPGAGGVASDIVDPGPIEVLRIMMHSASGSRPNNNQFYGATLEAGNDKTGRKLRLEGSDHTFHNCRFEGTTTDPETLTNGALTGSPPAEWSATGDFSFNGTAALFTPASGTGTLTQLSANFAIPMVANRMYHMRFTSSGTLPEGMTVQVSGITDTPKDMFVNAQTTPHGMYFLSGAAPGDFILTITVPASQVGTFTIDGIALLKIEPQITIGAADGTVTAISNWQRNIFIGGVDLAGIYEKNQIEYLNSGTYLHNQGNTFITGRGQETSNSGSTQFGKRSQHRLVNASSVMPILGLVNQTPDTGGTPGYSEFWSLYPERTIPWGGVAMQAFCDDSGAAQNWFGMINADPWDMRTFRGLNVANRMRIREDLPSTRDVILQNPLNGLNFLNAAGSPWVAYSSSTGANPLLAFANASRRQALTFKATESVAGQSYLGAGLYFDDDFLEHLADTGLAVPATWPTTGGVVVAAGVATCTANGTLTQLLGSFVLPVRPNGIYTLTYDAVNTGFNGTLALSGITGSLGLPTRTGTHSITFVAQTAPTDFVLTFVRNAGTLVVDNISLMAPTLKNVLGLAPAIDLGAARPLMLSNGLWVNQSQSNADTRVSGDVMLNLTYWDASADRVGFGTDTPDRLVDIEDSTNPALRLTHTSGSRYTDFQATNDANYGGLCIMPAVNTNGLRCVNIFGTTESNALTIMEDPGSSAVWMRTNLQPNLLFNVQSGGSYQFWINFASAMQIGPTVVTTLLPLASLVSIPTDTAEQAYQVTAQRTGGLPAAGFGVRLDFVLETNDGSDPGPFENVVDWRAVLDVATAGAVDSSTRFFLTDAGTKKEILRIAGGLPGVRIENNVAGAPAALLDVRGDAIFNEDGASVDWRAEGDNDPNLLFLDASADFVGIGTNTPGAKLDVRGGAIFNEDGNQVDFRVESDTLARMLFVDGTNNRVGIGYGAGSPLSTLDVNGTIRATSSPILVGGNPAGGVVGFVTHTNLVTVPAGATPATLGNTGGAGDPAGAAQSHWLKIWDGTTARYIPVWT